MITNSTTIVAIAIHAPARNFVMSTITSTVPVIASPMALTTRDLFIWERVAGSASSDSRRFQCRIMPSWLSVNETKTPTM